MTTTASTNNWDTVSAVKFKSVNAAIKAQGSSPSSFSGTASSPLGPQVTINGTFGAWSLSGGSGNLVHMTLPFAGVTAKNDSGTTTLGTGHAVIEVNLAYIPQPSNTQTQNLQVSPDQVVTDINVTMDQTAVQNWGIYVQAALLEWLKANLQSFNHVFAVVNLGAEESDKSFAWLKPTTVGYAVQTNPTGSVDDYVFGVLAMTENRQGIDLPYQVSPYAIPTGMDAGFLISVERFLEKMVMPGVYLIFLNATAADFDISNDGTTVTNIKDLQFRQFEVPTNADGSKTKIVSDAAISDGKFTITAFSTTLRFQFVDLTYTWQEGFTVNVNYTGVTQLTRDDKNHLLLPETQDPTVEFTVTKSTAEEWKEIGISIAIDIGAALVAAAIGGIAEAATAARAAATTAVEQTVTDAVADAGADASIDGAINIPLLTPEEQAELRAAQNLDALQSAATAVADRTATQSFTGFFLRNWKIILGIIVAEAIGTVAGEIPNILNHYAEKDLEHAPTLDTFANQAISPVQWANVPGFSLQSITLNGAVQMGLQQTTTTSPAAKLAVERLHTDALDKAHESKRGKALLKLPVSALAGATERHDDAFATLGIKTIRDLAEHPIVLRAQQLVKHNKA